MTPLSPAEQQALAELRRMLPGLRVVLIGAGAVRCHIELARVTHDVDLAVVAEAEDIEPHWRALGWTRSKRIAHRWQHTNGTWADVLPVSPALLARGSIEFDGAQLNLLGLDLALAHAEPRQLHDGTQLEVAALPALAVLKIIAWLDRPHERQKDLGDLVRMLERALPDDDERRWEAPLSDCQFDLQSALFLGLEVRRIGSDEHLAAVSRFLDLMRDQDGAQFAQLLRAARPAHRDVDPRIAQALDQFARGIYGVPGGHSAD